MTLTEHDHRGTVLIRIARDQLIRTLQPSAADPAEQHWRAEPWLLDTGAVFVTLRQHGDLRGCVGSLRATRPLIEDVRDNAVAAATRDKRFSPLTAHELDEIDIEVTELSEPRAMSFADEADALAQLRPGIDGVVLKWSSCRATFLPQVWDSLPEPEEFLAQLKRKAGLATDFWDDGIELERYQAKKWSEATQPGC